MRGQHVAGKFEFYLMTEAVSDAYVVEVAIRQQQGGKGLWGNAAIINNNDNNNDDDDNNNTNNNNNTNTNATTGRGWSWHRG